MNGTTPKPSVEERWPSAVEAQSIITPSADPAAELKALRAVYQAVAGLDAAARQRVLTHVQDWFDY